MLEAAQGLVAEARHEEPGARPADPGSRGTAAPKPGSGHDEGAVEVAGDALDEDARRLENLEQPPRPRARARRASTLARPR
eukprot:15462057-Alexandrium_andersonii.AAC.1